MASPRITARTSPYTRETGYIARGAAVYPTARQGECSSVPTYGKVRKMKYLLQSITIREINESINTTEELMSLSLWTYDVVQEWRPVFEHDMEFLTGLALEAALDELVSIDDTFPPVLESDHVDALTWLTDRMEELRRERDDDYDELGAAIQLIKRTINNYMNRGE